MQGRTTRLVRQCHHESLHHRPRHAALQRPRNRHDLCSGERPVPRAHQQRAGIAHLDQPELYRRHDPPGGHVLRAALERFLNEGFGRQILLRCLLHQRVHDRHRRGWNAAFESDPHRLGGEGTGQECEPEPEPHRAAGRTITTEFSRPKSSSTVRSARWSGTQRSPSTTNMYSYVPAGSTTVARHTPSWSWSSNAMDPGRQSLNVPTTWTDCASGNWPTNWAIPSCSASSGPPSSAVNSVSAATTTANATLQAGRTRRMMARGVTSQRIRRCARDGTGRRISAITRDSRLAAGAAGGAARRPAAAASCTTARRNSDGTASAASSPSST